jgi:hypothetical protein
MATVEQLKSLGQTYYTIEGDDPDDVEDMADRILRSYPHHGYGTGFDPLEQRADGSWVMHGHRSNSCD